MPKGLSQSWIAAQATLPPEWRLMGVVCGPRAADPFRLMGRLGAWPEG
jgi:hypothetical protein